MGATEQAAAGVFHKAIRFAFPWRPFQARVLDFFETQRETDRRYHVVAAPGAGKTVVGLEMVRRLDAPALVLCPTLNIRDQWVDTFARDFLPDDALPADWTTTDLAVPRPLTVITYQALHCACTGEADIEEPDDDEADEDEENGAAGVSRLLEVVEQLRAAGVRTLVVDEAHHLRAQWWATLTGIVAALGEIHLVALTATPPYDAPAGEWERYAALCGPVDIEVSIPEMVREGNLCPHQDYIYLNTPSPEEMQVIDEFRARVAEMAEVLNREGGLADAVAAHPWLALPKEHIEEILDDPAYFSAMLIYTKAVKLWVPPDLPKLLGVRGEEVPALDLPWLELLLTRALFSDRNRYETCEHLLDELEKQLRRMGAIERKRVVLQSTERIARFLTGSINKLQGIVEIVRREAGWLGPNLRMVILTDLIRRNEQPDSPFDLRPLKKMGAAPIFAALCRQARADAGLGDLREGSHLRHVRFGVLSGSLIILPLTTLPAWEAWTAEQGLPPNLCPTDPVAYDPDYVQIKVTDASRPYLVRGVTRLFQQGEIHVLVGTRALLGEGWDAPAINSLVLASTVRTSVLSNQMRGRSLRTWRVDPGKVANVWHLVCLDPSGADSGEDYALLEKRFQTFAGIGLHSDAIESGLGRLELPAGRLSPERIDNMNGAMLASAADRAGLAARWRRALAAKGVRAETVETLATPKAALPRAVLLRAASFDLGGQLLLAGAGLAAAIPSVLPGVIATHPWALLTAAAGGVAALWGVGGGIRTGVRMLCHATPASSLRQIARAVLAALQETGLISTPKERLELHLTEEGDGVACRLRGATLREQSLFLQSLRELCEPVENPRYLLLRKTFLFRMVRRVYHPVPRLLGGKKEWATALHQAWGRFVGPTRLIYTRTPAGRRLLLVARVQSSLQQAGGSRRLSQWE